MAFYVSSTAVDDSKYPDLSGALMLQTPQYLPYLLQHNRNVAISEYLSSTSSDYEKLKLMIDVINNLNLNSEVRIVERANSTADNEQISNLKYGLNTITFQENDENGIVEYLDVGSFESNQNPFVNHKPIKSINARRIFLKYNQIQLKNITKDGNTFDVKKLDEQGVLQFIDDVPFDDVIAEYGEFYIPDEYSTFKYYYDDVGGSRLPVTHKVGAVFEMAGDFQVYTGGTKTVKINFSVDGFLQDSQNKRYTTPNSLTHRNSNGVTFNLCRTNFSSALLKQFPQYVKAVLHYGSATFVVCTEDFIQSFYRDFNIFSSTIENEVTSLPVNEWSKIPQPTSQYEDSNPGSGGQTGGGTGGGSGTGSTNNQSDPIADGTDATGSSELSTSYVLNYNEVKELQDAITHGDMWTNISTFFKDPQDGIISMYRYPFAIPNVDIEHLTIADPIKIMGIDMKWNDIIGGATVERKVQGYTIDRAMKTRIDMGSITFDEFFGSFLDYEPYTKIQLYLPYFGYTDLQTDMVMGKTLSVYYNVHYSDGSAIAVLNANGIPIRIIEGQLGVPTPIVKSDALEVNQNRIKTALVGGLAVAGGAIAGGVKMAGTGGALKQKSLETITNASSGASTLTGSEMVQRDLKRIAVGGAVGSALSNGIERLTAKSHPSASGASVGSHARALSQVPYVIITRPTTDMPPDYGSIQGFPSNLNRKLSDCSGYTVCSYVKLDGMNGVTQSEQEEIRQILQSGVII